MKISPQWLRDFVDLDVNFHQLADALTQAGIAVESVRGEGDDTIFEMDVTTNRPDAMNHYGIARECSAIYDLPLQAIQPKLSAISAVKPVSSKVPSGASEAAFPIEIQDPEGCARFTGRVLRGVTIKSSPANIAQRLALLDQRPISNAVDATNYTLWEMGKPTHVFDLDLLEGGTIIVRRARAGEMLKTLDGVERKLTPEDLVVADARKPVGLAGTMGGFDTMITEKTRNILIESAWWDPVLVRKMSRRHGLHTDASHRFERGADYESTVLSCDRVAELILQSGGGELMDRPIDVIARPLDMAPIALHVAEVHRILGAKIEVAEILRILRHLGFELVPEPGEEVEFTVHVPSWRLDVEREIDLIEEIARLHGYDKFANTLPAYVGSVVEQPDAEKEEKLRTALLALGYNEAISSTFISHQDAEQFSAVPVIELANPLSEESSVMRTSMAPGMLNMMAYNLNRDNHSVRLFEAGNVFEATGNKTVEMKRIGIGSTGDAVDAGVHQRARSLTFFDLKGDVETLLAFFQHAAIEYDPKTPDYYHPGLSARAVIDGEMVAEFGKVSLEVASGRKIKQDVFLAEIHLDTLLKHSLREVRYQALPRHPAVERDFSFIFADSVVFARIQRTVDDLPLPELRNFVPAEIFRGGAVPSGKYSILLRASFQSNDRTLREEEVAQWSGQIIHALAGLGGTLRA